MPRVWDTSADHVSVWEPLSSYQSEWTELPPMVMVIFRPNMLLRGMLSPCSTTAKVCVDILCLCYYKRPMGAISVEVQGGVLRL